MFNLSDTIARTCKWMWGICLQCKMSYKFVLSVLHSVTATVVSLLCTSRWRDAQTTELTDLLNAKSDLENILLLFKLSVSQQVLAAAEPLGDLINSRLTQKNVLYWQKSVCGRETALLWCVVDTASDCSRPGQDHVTFINTCRGLQSKKDES